MTLDLNNQLGVAVLAVIGSLIIREIGIPERLQTLIPCGICITIFWLFVDLPGGVTTLIHGLVSGLLASGLLYIITGWTRRS
jgi:hypothetical protein